MTVGMSLDYYWTLGLPRHASDSDVRKSYRRLALQWHPKNFQPEERFEAKAKFSEISEAFEVLSNRQRRMLYDKYGSQGFLDFSDVGIDLDRVDLSRPLTTSINGVVNGGHHPTQQQRPGGVTMKDARGGGTPYKHLRDPDDVFYEAFGCREPSSSGPDGEDERTYSGFLHDINRFEHTFPGFSQPSRKVVLERPRAAPGSRVVTSFKGSVFSSPTDQGDYLTQAMSDAVVNGRNVITKRNILNGREIVTVEEDGVLVSKTVDGEPRDLH